jgi:hypothetical protein
MWKIFIHIIATNVPLVTWKKDGYIYGHEYAIISSEKETRACSPGKYGGYARVFTCGPS